MNKRNSRILCAFVVVAILFVLFQRTKFYEGFDERGGSGGPTTAAQADEQYMAAVKRIAEENKIKAAAREKTKNAQIAYGVALREAKRLNKPPPAKAAYGLNQWGK